MNSELEDTWESFLQEIRAEREKTLQEIEELELMIEQSQLEVNKLARRNSSITAHLQQMMTQFDSVSREDLRSAYEAALESQQRLFLMRGQLDKLQSDQAQLQRYRDLLIRIEEVGDNGIGGSIAAGNISGRTATAEKLETMVQAQEDERRRLSRQIHDGPAQALSNFILQTEIAMRLFDIDPDKARQELSNLKVSATSAFQQLREFIIELRPMMLDDLGLIPTLRRYIESYEKQSGAQIRLTIAGPEQRLESYLEVLIFRALQELLANATRHGQATQINVQVAITEQLVKVGVEDNGSGFDLTKLEEHKGVGLDIIRNRVEMSGGKFDLESTLGQGTRVSFQIPLSKSTLHA